MANAAPRIEALDTRKFVAVYSATPSTPVLTLTAGSGDGFLVASITATVSANGTACHAFYTFPASRMLYAWTWTASFTNGPILFRGLVQVIQTIPG